MKVTIMYPGDDSVGIPSYDWSMDLPDVEFDGDMDYRGAVREAVLNLAKTIDPDTNGPVYFEDECTDCWQPMELVRIGGTMEDPEMDLFCTNPKCPSNYSRELDES